MQQRSAQTLPGYLSKDAGLSSRTMTAAPSSSSTPTTMAVPATGPLSERTRTGRSDA